MSVPEAKLAAKTYQQQQIYQSQDIRVWLSDIDLS